MQFFLSLVMLFFWNSAYPADAKISALTSLNQASWASGDLFTLVDISTATTKKTTVGDFDGRYVLQSGFASAFDTRLALKDTDDIAEGSNLYHTTARVNSAFDTRLATKSTTDLTEGTNLYYTNARFDTRLATKSSTDVAEGTNLYFTNARAIAAPLTGYSSGAGTVAATDSILQGIQKLNGNIVGYAASTKTLTNTTIDADGAGNAISNIEDADIKAAAAIDASKIADGTVSSAEFQRINSVTSNVQTQINAITAISNIHPTLGVRIVENWYSGAVGGNNGWVAANNTGGSGMNISVGSTTRMGLFRLETLGNTAASPILSLGGGASVAFGGLAHLMDTEILIGTLATVGDDYDVKVGFHNGSIALWTNAAMFEYDRGTSGDFWRCVTRSASGGTTTTVTTTPVTASWVRLTVLVNAAGSQVDYYIDNVLVATHTTAANIPNGVTQPISPAFHIIKSAGTNSRLIYGDWAIIGVGTGATYP